MATMAANPTSMILKKAAEEMAKNITPAPEMQYAAFYGTTDDKGQHPSDEVMKHIATRHYASHDIANVLKTVAKLAFFITLVVALFKIPEMGNVILELIRDAMIGG